MESNNCLTDASTAGEECKDGCKPESCKMISGDATPEEGCGELCGQNDHCAEARTSCDTISTEKTPLVNGYYDHVKVGGKECSHCECDSVKPSARTEPENGKIAHNCCSSNHNHIAEHACGEDCAHSDTGVEEAVCDSEDLLSQDSECDTQVEELTTSFSSFGVDELIDCKDGLIYTVYKSEEQMPSIMNLITKDLSEPYSIYTYRYFIHNWPKLCFVAMDDNECVGAIVCKLDMHKKVVHRGYIAMLAVDKNYRRRRIGSHLVKKAIRAMIADDCDEVVLETEITNRAALHLYENLGFVRDKRLFRYYLNGVDALRLKLWLK